MKGVSVIGAGMVPFGKFPDKSLAEIAAPAVLEALGDGGVKGSDINVAYCGTAFGGLLAGQRILKTIGITGIPIINVENACSGGSTALHEACLGITSGRFEVALVIGVDKLTKFGGGTLPLEQEDWEVQQGLTMPALYSMRARRYMHEYGLTAEHLARVAVKAHEHGALNPDAQLRGRYTIEQVINSRPIAEPFTLLHCCPTGDGAAALVVCAEAVAPRFTSRPVRVIASELSSGRFEPGFRDMTSPEITVRGAAIAYEEAGLGPDDINVAEVHDAFTIAELLYYEAFGFCEQGGAYQLLESGATSLGGRRPVNPSGGLLSRGHPVGATGTAQVVEIVRQLRGECGARQVEGAKVGLTHATGGGVAGFDHGACSIHIFAR